MKVKYALNNPREFYICVSITLFLTHSQKINQYFVTLWYFRPLPYFTIHPHIYNIKFSFHIKFQNWFLKSCSFHRVVSSLKNFNKLKFYKENAKNFFIFKLFDIHTLWKWRILSWYLKCAAKFLKAIFLSLVH